MWHNMFAESLSFNSWLALQPYIIALFYESNVKNKIVPWDLLTTNLRPSV